jgi:uncharacterized membrane protein YidH (DUF202 family)
MSDPRTSPHGLDLDPNYLAATRTLLAILRTGAAIASAGVVVPRLLVWRWPEWVIVALSSGFVLLGYATMWMTLRRSRELRAHAQRLGVRPIFTHRQFTALTLLLQALIGAAIVLYLLRP